MKNIFKLQLWAVLIAGIFSCNKAPLTTNNTSQSLYHFSFFDHSNGKKLPGMKVDVGNCFTDQYIFKSAMTFLTDSNGQINYIPSAGTGFMKIYNPDFVNAIYNATNLFDPSKPDHYTLMPVGPNMVNVKLLRNENESFYFTADLYRKAAIDLHIVQVSDFSNTNTADLKFNVTVEGLDPVDIRNNFLESTPSLEDLNVFSDSKIDTTIRIYGFGDYLNKIRWSVYGYIEADLQFEIYPTLNIVSYGELPEKLFPSDTPTKITITF
jgi:hypothetical protein